MSRTSRTPFSIPVGVFLQDKIWIDGRGQVMNVEDIPDGHLDNLIEWMDRHKNDITQHVNEQTGSSHLASYKPPLYRKLVRVHRKRDTSHSAAFRAATDAAVPVTLPAGFITRFLSELEARGYEVTKIARDRDVDHADDY